MNLKNADVLFFK